MKVLQSKPVMGAAVMALFATMFAAILFVPVAPAGALTRSQVISRANTWVKKRIPYSQKASFQGYRRDCSGFVSMAWKLRGSYTTRNISSKANRIAIKDLRPGDAVLTKGHVAIFGGWKNKRRGQYVAIEQTTWGDHARKHVRSIPRGAKGLRLRGIKNDVAVAKAPVAAPAPAPAPTAPTATDVSAVAPTATNVTP